MIGYIGQKMLLDRLVRADERLLHKLVRDAELHILSQRTIATSTNRKAVNLSCFLMAASFALTVFAARFSTGDKQSVALAIVCICVAAAFLVSVWLAIQSAGLEKFDFVVNSLDGLDNEAGMETYAEQTLPEQCATYVVAIGVNQKRMERNSRLLLQASNLSSGALAVGAAAFVLTLVSI